MKACKYCKSEVNEGADYCGHCGKNIVEWYSPKQAIIAIVLILVIMALAKYIFK